MISQFILHPGLMQSSDRRPVSVVCWDRPLSLSQNPFFSPHQSSHSFHLSLPCRDTTVSFYGLKVTRSSMRSNLNLIHSITVGDYRMGGGRRNTGLSSLAALLLSFSSRDPCRPHIKPWLWQKLHVQSLVLRLHKLFIAVPRSLALSGVLLFGKRKELKLSAQAWQLLVESCYMGF